MGITITEIDLIDWILIEIPDLKPLFERENLKRDYPWNSYALFSYVLNPYLKSLLQKDAFQELQLTFNSIDFIANYGDKSVKNELNVAMEELEDECHLLWPFFSNTLRENVKESITSYPLFNQNTEPVNRSIDQIAYLKKWEEKVRKIGGWHKLSIPYLLKIRFELIEEFDIQSMISIEPGGKEWKESNLPWPI
ncbi:MAG: hypothetical protein BalsKO_02750 [Balneolaceae bacterium]